MSKDEMFLSSFSKMINTRRNLNKLKRRNCLPDYHYTEIGCIALIDKMEDANVTKLSEAFYMTRGGVSKTIKKLLSYGAIESYQKPENKKEVYFKLTAKGREIYEKNNELAAEMREIDNAIFNLLDDKEKDVVIKFLEIYNQKLEAHIEKENILRNEGGSL